MADRHEQQSQSETIPLSKFLLTNSLTTALQSGGWVPETSRSFHFWQPAPSWRPLPWLANPGNLATSPPAEGEKTGTHHTDKTVKRREGQGRGDSLQGVSTLRKMLTFRKMLKPQQNQENEESWRMRISNRPCSLCSKLLTLLNCI